MKRRRDWTYETPGEHLSRQTSGRTKGTFDSGVRVIMKHPKGWMYGETEYARGGGMRVAWDHGEPVGYTSLPNPRVLHVSHMPPGAKLASARRDRSRRRGRRDEAAPVVAGDRRRRARSLARPSYAGESAAYLTQGGKKKVAIVYRTLPHSSSRHPCIYRVYAPGQSVDGFADTLDFALAVCKKSGVPVGKVIHDEPSDDRHPPESVKNYRDPWAFFQPRRDKRRASRTGKARKASRRYR